MRNWKTTTAGILAIVAALAAAGKAFLDGDPSTNPDWSSAGAAIMAGLGLVAASDAKKPINPAP